MCMPGDNVEIEVELIMPIAMDEHHALRRFAKAAAPSVPVVSPKIIA